MNNIPQCSPLESFLGNKKGIEAAIARVLNSGWFILGKEVKEFENSFARYCKSNYAIGVGSGTDALFLSLRALNIGPGDGVITVSHTAVASITGIRMTGATPILFDIDPDTFNIDVNRVKEYLHEKGRRGENDIEIKAILPVHLYGNPCDIDQIYKLAKEFDLFIVEDCAQAHGAEVGGRKVGSFGDVGCFSFYPTKNLGAIGDGGAVVTSNVGLCERLNHLRQYGWKDRYISSIEGYNSRLDELQAAILSEKLKRLDNDNQNRISIAEWYLSGIKNEQIILPYLENHKKHVFHLFVIKSNKRVQIIEHLNEAGISSAIHYPLPVHKQSAYTQKCIIPYALTITEKIGEQIISLPLYPEMKREQVEYVIECLNNFEV